MPAHRVDLNGQKFGALTVIGPADDKIDNSGYKHTSWRCVCDCGNHVIATTQRLRDGSSYSCGCLYHNPTRSPKDLLGKKFGLLTVVRIATKEEIASSKFEKRHGTIFLCQCDCGNTILMPLGRLRQDHGTKSCGCLRQKNKEDAAKLVLGKKFGRLTVIGYIATPGQNMKLQCLCDCGNIVYTEKSNLEGGWKTSCGCALEEVLRGSRHPRGNYKDLTGKRFGRLQVLERANLPDKEKTYWMCKCECGAITYTSSTDLNSGASMSCGCLHSKGEEIIANILIEHNIAFQKQYQFSDLRSNKGRPFRFDFGILSSKGQLSYLIEYDGVQHFHPTSGRNTPEQHNKVRENDQIKNQYCADHKIPLIRILYTHFKDLCLEDLLLESTGFLFCTKDGDLIGEQTATVLFADVS